MLKYEEAYREKYLYRFFIHAGSEDKFMRSCQAVLDRLELPEREKPGRHLKISAIHKWLKETDNWLLLFDNVGSEEGHIIRDLLPSEPRGHVLLTSQWERAVRLITGSPQLCHELKEPEEEDAIDMFFEVSEIEKRSEYQKLVKEIVEEVGLLPHAIDQAASYIKVNCLELDQYLSRYREAPHQVRFLSYSRITSAVGRVSY